MAVLFIYIKNIKIQVNFVDRKNILLVYYKGLKVIILMKKQEGKICITTRFLSAELILQNYRF